MITYGELDKLRSVRAPDESVLSLYLDVPPDQAGVRKLPARAAELIRAADGAGRAPDLQMARQVVAAHSRGWLGHTLAAFLCADLGLVEVVQLPPGFGERAVWAVRPHIRPLLAALQRHPDHRVVIADQQNIWLLAVADGAILSTSGAGTSLGWRELDQIQQPVRDLDRHDFREAAEILAVGDPQPIVLGGHPDAISGLLADLPPQVRDGFAGSFAADPAALTPERACDLAAPVIARRAEHRERQLAQDLTGVVRGLTGCLAAVNAEEADLLLIPDRGMAPGYRCERCGVLSLTGEECCDWGAASRAVPDLLEEMELSVLRDGGEVVSVCEPQFVPVAHLHQDA